MDGNRACCHLRFFTTSCQFISALSVYFECRVYGGDLLLFSAKMSEYVFPVNVDYFRHGVFDGGYAFAVVCACFASKLDGYGVAFVCA